MAKKKKKSIGKFILYKILFVLVRFLNLFVWRYKRLNTYKIKKDETVVVVSNHQAFLDPMFVLLSFNKLLRPVATDNLLAGTFNSLFYGKFLGVIPKRKGASDLKSTASMLGAIQNGDSLLLFPEGNRAYAEFQFYIADNFARFIKLLKSTLIIFNIHGGFGCDPRWGNKKRRGRFEGGVKIVLKYEEYKDMSDEELNSLIKENIKVFDSESGYKYKSSRRAEYLERFLYVCPKCHSISTLYSDKNHLYCKNCDLDVEYKEDLHLASKTEGFNFEILNDWYQFQQEYVRNLEIKPGEIFHDSYGVLKVAEAYGKGEEIDKGEIILTDKELKVGSTTFKVKDIESASPVFGTTLQFTIKEKGYTIKGHSRFNPVKYVQILSKLDTPIKEKGDPYFGL